MATEVELPTLLASAVYSLGYHISTSKKIEGVTNCFDSSGFNHPQSKLTSQHNCSYESLTEHLTDLCGEGAVWLYYGNEDLLRFTSPREGRIRLLMFNDLRYIKKYDVTGTFAFRTESLLSHLSTLHGAFPTKMPYALKPGQLPPVRDTDENIRGGVYFYGSLLACLLHDFATFGDIDFNRLRHRRCAKQLEDFFNLNVISVLQVTNVIAGPSANGGRTLDIWSKSISSPGNAFITGCILTQDQINAFGVMKLNELKSFLSGMVDILKTPSNFLSQEGNSFLRRYVAGGVFLAHAYSLPLRLITVCEFEPSDVEWIAEKLIHKYIAAFITDDSFENPVNKCVKDALKKWVVGGLSNEKVIYDPSNSKCYTLREVANLFERGEVRKRLQMANCGWTDDYNSAVRSVVNYAFQIGDSPKKRKFTPEKSEDQTSKRSRYVDEDSADLTAHRSKSLAHFLARSIARTIYDFLGGQETQLSSVIFMDNRYESMITFLKDYLENDPYPDWAQLVNSVTRHILDHRMDWGLYFKKTLEIHPICRKNVEGKNRADEVAIHVSLVASNIIQDASRSYKELYATSHTASQPYSARSDPPLNELHRVSYNNVLVKVTDAVSGIEILNMPFSHYSKINDVKKASERARGNPARGICLFHNVERLENNIILGQYAEVDSEETYLLMRAHFL